MLDVVRRGYGLGRPTGWAASGSDGSQRGSELIARCRLAETVLAPQPIAGRGESAVRAVDQVEGAGAGAGSDALRRHPDREVGVAVSIEVARGERRPE